MDHGQSIAVRFRNRAPAVKRLHWIVIFIWSVLVRRPLRIKDAVEGIPWPLAKYSNAHPGAFSFSLFLQSQGGTGKGSLYRPNFCSRAEFALNSCIESLGLVRVLKGSEPPACSRLGDGHLMKFFAFDCNAAQARATFAWHGRPMVGRWSHTYQFH